VKQNLKLGDLEKEAVLLVVLNFAVAAIAVFSIPYIVGRLSPYESGIYLIALSINSIALAIGVAIGKVATRITVAQFLKKEQNVSTRAHGYNRFVATVLAALLTIAIAAVAITCKFGYITGDMGNFIILIAFSTSAQVMLALARADLEGSLQTKSAIVWRALNHALSFIAPCVAILIAESLNAIAVSLVITRIIEYMVMSKCWCCKLTNLLRQKEPNVKIALVLYPACSAAIGPVFSASERALTTSAINLAATSVLGSVNEVVSRINLFSAMLTSIIYSRLCAAIELRGARESENAFKEILLLNSSGIAAIAIGAHGLIQYIEPIKLPGVSREIISQIVPWTLCAAVGTSNSSIYLMMVNINLKTRDYFISQLVQLPIYAAAIVVVGRAFGMTGIVIVTAVRSWIDCLLTARISRGRDPRNVEDSDRKTKGNWLYYATIATGLCIPAICSVDNNIKYMILAAGVLIAAKQASKIRMQYRIGSTLI